MPRFRPDALRRIGYQFFEAAGCTGEEARDVVDHLVDSNLYGHDSHGVIRFLQYLNGIRKGHFRPTARPKVVRQTACMAVVDADGALGQVGAIFASKLAIEMARRQGLAAVTLRNTSHIGRLGAYPLMAARAGMIGHIFVNAGRYGAQVAPFGGIDGRLATNPIAFAAPRRDAEPILLDMATSVVAEGKLRVAENRRKKVPEGWIIDHDGNPSREPADVKADPPGAILPLGDVAAHKGYGLGVFVEVLGGALSGQGCAAGEDSFVSNGVLFTVYSIEHFVDLETYYEEIESLVKHLKSSRLQPGYKEILLPGEPELQSEERRRVEGIDVEETTWALICKEAQALGLDPSPWADE